MLIQIVQNQKTISCNFLLTNLDQDKDRKVVLFNQYNLRGDKRASQIVSVDGNQFFVDEITFGAKKTGRTSNFSVTQQLLENVPIQARLIFKTSSLMNQLTLVELKVVDNELGVEADTHPIRFRNVKVTQ